MTRISTRVLLAACAALATVSAQANNDDENVRARMSTYQEVPALSTTGVASFSAKVTGHEIRYELTYRGIASGATQAHIHFGQKSVNGGIAVFLCSNLGNGPIGTQACPAQGGTVRGTITAANVIGPAGQGIAPGEFDELIKAIRAEVTYANVHSVAFPGGEVRGQIKWDD